MLDIQFIRDNAELVKEKSKQKGYDVDIDELLKLDMMRRKLIGEAEELRAKRNEMSSGQKPSEEQIAAGKELKEKIVEAEKQLKKVVQEFITLHKTVPNMPTDDVPVGSSEDENVVAKTVGDKPKFDFEPKSHAEIGETNGWIDKERAAKVTGSRFAYIKGELVKLQFALIQFTLDSLTNEEILKKIATENNLKINPKPFIPVLPPAMIRTEVYDAMDRLEPREDRYKVGTDEDNLWLQGSAEHVLGSMHMREDIPYEELPIRYLGYSSSFRREAGNYGKDTEGIFRMHQFDKLEMESITDEKSGLEEHKFLIAIQEYLTQQLGISYQVIRKCTADIGKPNATGVDINAWFPSQDKYRETHTADYMTDYQARRLNMLYRRWIPARETNQPEPANAFSAGSKVFLVHTNDATAFALGRTMAAIMENYQTKDGNFEIPEVLKPYLGK